MISVGIDVSKGKSTACILKPYGEIISKISKRGSSILRKIGYETMRVLKTHAAPDDDAVYWYILKKKLRVNPNG